MMSFHVKAAMVALALIGGHHHHHHHHHHVRPVAVTHVAPRSVQAPAPTPAPAEASFTFGEDELSPAELAEYERTAIDLPPGVAMVCDGNDENCETIPVEETE